MSKIETVNEENFNREVIESKVPTLVDFFTPECAPCKPLSMVLQKFYQTVEGKLKIVKFNAEECDELAKQLGVRGVPTLMLFRDGKVIETRTGFLFPHQLRQWIDTCLSES